MIKRIICFVILIGVLLSSLPVASAAAADKPSEITLGVLAFRPKPIAEAQWAPLVRYLNETLHGTHVSLRVLTYPEMDEAVAQRKVDIVLTQPAHYVLMSYHNKLTSPMATLVTLDGGVPLRSFGGVIVALAEREDLMRLADLKGKKIATASVKSFGGYLMAAYELQQAGVPLPIGERLIETGMPQDHAINEVLAKAADAAFVRSGLIEEMQKEGRIKEGQLRVINQQQAFPFALSTRMYPEWPLVALPHVNDLVASEIAAALFKLPHGGEVAQQISIYGFVVPMDYHPVEELLRALRQPPFNAAPKFTTGDIWHKFRGQIVLAGVMGALVLLLLVLLTRYSHRLRELKSKAEDGDNRLQQLSQQLPGVIYQYRLRTDGTSHYPYASEGTRKLFGLSPEALNENAENLFAILHPDDVKEFHARVRQSAETMQAWKGEYRVILENGNAYWREANAWPQQQDDGSILWHGFVTDITERKALEAELMHASILRRQVLAALGEGIVGMDLEGRVTLINPRALEMLGLNEEAALGHNMHALSHARHLDGSNYPVEECPMHLSMKDGRVRRQDDWFWRRDGRGFPVSLIITPIEEGGQRTGVVASFVDITESQAAAAHNQLLVAALEACANSVVITDVDGKIEWVNPAFCALTGYSLDEVIGGTPQLLKSGMHDDSFYSNMWQTLLTGKSWRGEIINRRKDGCLVEEELMIAPVKDAKGFIHHFVGVKQDISERKRLEDELRFQANSDTLTGLPNRRRFFDLAEAELARIRRSKAGGATLVMLDLDHFKRINDTHGHAVGDLVLLHFADTVRSTLRRSDIAGRIGGEEFVILLPETTVEQGWQFAERLREKLANAPITVQNLTLHCTASFGLTVMDSADTSIDIALARADEAMYRAKEGGRNRVEMA